MMERVLRVCDGLFCSMLVTYDVAVVETLGTKTRYFVNASHLDRKPMK